MFKKDGPEKGAGIIKNRLFQLVLLAQFVLVISFLGYRDWRNSDVECVRCHSDKAKLQRLGYPDFYVTPQLVEKESKHKNLSCLDCHLGNGRAADRHEAHKGMLRAMFINEGGQVVNRLQVWRGPLVPRDKSIRALLPRDNYDVRNLLWQDRNPKTFNFDPDIAKKTCAKPSCHPEELKQFRNSHMGANFRQRTMKTWLTPYGPHNCGPSFADLQPTGHLDGAGFDFKNTARIQKEVNVKFTRQQAIAKQKFCNVCHAGCLDCHYAPDARKGVHNFEKVPLARSCSGYGRGTSICHPGAMQSRRGETYIGGSYSIPEGMTPDVHYTKGLKCVDCHITGPKGMGDIVRNAVCQDCHIEAEDNLAKSVHKDLDCATCHISELRGYQLTMWGKGYVEEKPNPFNKFSLYYGIQKPPIIIKDQKGRWMPVKIWPHSLEDFARVVPPSPHIMFRWPDGQTRDAYYIVGTITNAPAGNNYLLWLEIEQAAHPYGKARPCASCHNGGRGQVATSTWQFMDDQGSLPFNGTHKVVADKNGIRIEGLRNTTPIKVLEGSSIADFASWVYFRNAWKMPGDFAITEDPVKYKKELALTMKAEREIKEIERHSAGFDKKKRIEFKRLKEAVFHNGEAAQGLIKAFEAGKQASPAY